MNVESVACQNYAGYVLSNVMDVSLYRCNDHYGLFGRFVVLAHIWFQDGDGIPHYLCRLHDLRKEHLAVSEQFSDSFHAGHQRPFNDLQSAFSLVKEPLQVGFKVGRHAFDNCFCKTCSVVFVSMASSVLPVIAVLTVIATFSVIAGLTGNLLLQTCRLHDQPLSSLAVPVEDHILHAFKKLGLDLVIDLKHRRVDNGHVETGLYRMIEEGRVHGFSHCIVSAECEREV